MFCNKCGKELKNDAKFCTACGNKVENTDNIQFQQPDNINAFSDDGSEKTVYLPEENPDNQPESIGQSDFFGDSPTELIRDNDFNDMDIQEEDLSDDPSSIDEDQYGQSETVILRKNETQSEEEQTQIFHQDIGGEPDLIDKEEDQYGRSETVILRKNDAQSQEQQPEFNPVQPEREIPHQNDSAFNGMNTGAFQQNQYNGGYPSQKQFPQPGIDPFASPVMPADKNAAPVKVGKGRIFGASTVAFFAIIFLIVLSVLVCFKIGASGSNLNSRIQKINLNTVLNAEFDGKDVTENLYDTIGFGSVTHGNANISDFKEFLKKSDILEYAGKNVQNYADYIFAGEGKDPSITSEDITYDFFGENNDAADEAFGYTFVKKDLKKIQSNLENEDVDKNLSVKEWEKEIGIGLGNLSYLVSYITIGILSALIVVLLIWIVIIVDKKGRHIMGFFGNTMFISGLVVFICGIGVTVGSMIAFSLSSNVAFYLISNILLDFGILALIIGFSELLIGFIFKKIGKRLKRKNKLAEETMPVNQNAAAAPAYNYN